jgi:hypothetical protein
MRWANADGTILVLDERCDEVASWPFTVDRQTVVVTSDNRVELTQSGREANWTAPPGLERVNQLPADDCP